MSVFFRPRVRYLALALLALGCAVPPLAAQAPSPRGGTHARKGLAIGAVAGGIVGGLSFFLLGLGLCESSSCDADAVGLGMLGTVVGAAGGGLTGLVIGAAIPRRGGEATDPGHGDSVPDAPAPAGVAAPASRWSAVVALGPSIGTGDDFPGRGLWASLAVLRPTTSRVRWGVELGHLGRRSSEEVYTDLIGSDPPTTFRSLRARTLWNASLVAVRALGEEPPQRRYLLTSVGLYPSRETVRYSRPPTVPGGNGASTATTPLPGLSVGGGGAWAVSPGAALGIESRLHLLLGADEGVAGLLTLGGTLRFRR